MLDEQLNDGRMIRALARWYVGAVLTINELRPGTLIDDDEIAALLRQQKDAVFVTLNYTDFWQIIEPHSRYCIVCFKLTIDRKLEIPERLRELFQAEELNTKRKRAGKVISVTDQQISLYSK